MSKILTRSERREMLDRLMAYLEKHILPEENEVEIEISQPPINDLREEALDPMGMVHLKPGPDIYIKMHIALGRYNPRPKRREETSRRLVNIQDGQEDERRRIRIA